MLFATSSKLTRETREIKRLGDTIETKASLALFSIFFLQCFFFFMLHTAFVTSESMDEIIQVWPWKPKRL